MSSVLQGWVTTLGLRHQGVLVSAMRGCDSEPKEDATKALTRCLRGVVLHSYDKHPSSFIEYVGNDELHRRMVAVLKNHDHYPVHYITHLMHAAEIIGFKHPVESVSVVWKWFYEKLCRSFHVNPETEQQMDERLGACEEVFAQRASI